MDDPEDPGFSPSPRTAAANSQQSYSIFVLDMAAQLGIDVDGGENDLLWLAEDAANAQLPLDWEEHEGEYEGALHKYYVNSKTGESVWTHPVVTEYLLKLEEERTRRGGGAVSDLYDDDNFDEDETDASAQNNDKKDTPTTRVRQRNDNEKDSGVDYAAIAEEFGSPLNDDEVKIGSATKSEPESPSDQLIQGLRGKRPSVISSKPLTSTSTTAPPPLALTDSTTRSVATAKLSFNFDDVEEDKSVASTASPPSYRPSTLAAAVGGAGPWRTAADAAGAKPPSLSQTGNPQRIVPTETPKREDESSLLNDSQVPLSAGRSAEEEERWLHAREMLALVEAAEEEDKDKGIKSIPLLSSSSTSASSFSLSSSSSSLTAQIPNSTAAFNSITSSNTSSDVPNADFSPVRRRVRAIEAKVSELESQKRSAEVAKEEVEEQLSKASKAVIQGTTREAELKNTLAHLNAELERAKATLKAHEATIISHKQMLEEAKVAAANEKRIADNAFATAKKTEALLRNDVLSLEQDLAATKAEAEKSSSLSQQRMKERVAEVEAQGQLVCKALDAALKAEVQRAAKVTADLERLGSSNSEATSIMSRELQEKETALRNATNEILRLETKLSLDLELLRAQTDKAVAEATLAAGLESDTKWQKQLIDAQERYAKSIRESEHQRGLLEVTISRLTNELSDAQRKTSMALSEVRALTESNNSLSIEVLEMKARVAHFESTAAIAAVASTSIHSAPSALERISVPAIPVAVSSTSIWESAKREVMTIDKRRITDSKGVAFSSSTSNVLKELGISFPSRVSDNDDFEIETSTTTSFSNKKSYAAMSSPQPRVVPPPLPPPQLQQQQLLTSNLHLTPDSKRTQQSSFIGGSGRLSLSQLRLASPALRAKRNILASASYTRN